MNHGELNSKFLKACTPKARSMILSAAADHYGVSQSEMLEEVTHDEAENLLDYLPMTERAAASVLMQRHGFR